MDIQDQFKKGWRTSEFWVALLTTIGPLVGIVSKYDIDTQQLGLAIGGIISGGLYVFGRTWLKRKRVDALGVVASASLYAPPTPDGIDSGAPIDPAGTDTVLSDG